MAKVTTVVAKNDIYYHGLRVVKVHASGKNVGKEYTTVDRFKPRDADDWVFIAKGETYYTWSLFMQSPSISKSYPRPSQTTGNAFFQEYYRIQEVVGDLQVGAFAVVSDLKYAVEDVISDLQSLADEQGEKLDNMPDGLRENSDSGQILQERLDGVQSTIDELESIDLDVDEGDEDFDLSSWLTEKIEEIQGVDFSL